MNKYEAIELENGKWVARIESKWFFNLFTSHEFITTCCDNAHSHWDDHWIKYHYAVNTKACALERISKYKVNLLESWKIKQKGIQ